MGDYSKQKALGIIFVVISLQKKKVKTKIGDKLNVV